MLTEQENQRLTQVGPGTPAGELLRRYWQALCPTKELSGKARKKRIEILGEKLLVLRQDDGTFACISEQCAHRSASLYFGFIEPDGIRCCYHGWKYDCATGACIERPFETAAPTAKMNLKAYPVQQLGGLLFVYMGPDPAAAPPLPHWDVIARTDRPRTIAVLPDHKCNWLQIQENTVDTAHTYYLHGEFAAVNQLESKGVAEYYHRPIEKYDWAVSHWGVEKTLVYGGDKPEVEVRPPLIFPNILRVPVGPVESMHFRIPIDDERTRIIWVGLMPEGSAPLVPDAEVPYEIRRDPPNIEIEEYDVSTVWQQDRVVWETQGVIADRSRENLAATDRGIVMFRRMLQAQIELVEAGGDPTVAVVSPDDRTKIITFDSATQPWNDGVAPWYPGQEKNVVGASHG
ncbi:MAG TPA: Rieske 2Fe-2S domain-containing protein [Candidatus Lustribacter sp.]|jgi:5,5'-dehydrodivanillate O-demethylase|nr:Rieske 2Fe-2S domain-containing protein [Candidatus Lustribacter sp.]